MMRFVAEVTAPRPLRVLVVEDDAAQRHILRLSLEKRGHRVVLEATRGDDARILQTAADVAVIDIGLPGKSGIEVIRALRATTSAVRVRGLPVLVLSASAHSAAVTEALLAGALGYVVKGARISDIVDAVEVVADKKQVLPAHPRADTPAAGSPGRPPSPGPRK